MAISKSYLEKQVWYLIGYTSQKKKVQLSHLDPQRKIYNTLMPMACINLSYGNTVCAYIILNTYDTTQINIKYFTQFNHKRPYIWFHSYEALRTDLGRQNQHNVLWNCIHWHLMNVYLQLHLLDGRFPSSVYKDFFVSFEWFLYKVYLDRNQWLFLLSDAICL